MDLQQLELFLAVIDQSSVTKAAGSMRLSPSAISLQLRNLAVRVRMELFVKSGKRLLPTLAALLLAERARLLLRHVDRIEHEFGNDPATDSQSF
jgi:DNA-binding transcriptional LysR family regulator